MKVAINKCFGGFSPSEALFGALIAKGWEVTRRNAEGLSEDPYAPIIDFEDRFAGFCRYAFRDRYSLDLRKHPDLIDAIETLGDAASGRCGKLVVVEIPDDVDFTIEEYDGYEHIAEVPRTWG